MQVSNWIIFGIAELMALLLVVCAFLLLYARNLKGLLLRLQEKLSRALEDLSKSRKACEELKQAHSNSSSYVELIDQQISETISHHHSLHPDEEMSLNLDSDGHLPSQAASLRHAFLISEKEATLGSKESGKPNWDILQTKLGNLIRFFHTESRPANKKDSTENSELEELEQALINSQLRVENLEKFKTLFFDLEEKWDLAQQQAQVCHQELSNFEVDANLKDDFDNILQRYQNAYESFGSELQSGASTPTLTQVVHVPGAIIQPTEELQRLKSVAANQHNLITELQQRLAIAYSAEEKAAIITELQTQLEQQLRYVQESETCIELMENELNEAHKTIEHLQEQIDSLELLNSQNEKNLKAANILKQEREMMNKNIQRLEQENDQLALQMQAIMEESHTSAPTSDLQKRLDELQQQYTQLEDRYLTLRMKE